MNKILLIGNSGTRHKSLDGQTVKVRLYLKKIKDEGFDVLFIDLESFIKRPFSTLIRIKRGVKECDRIVLITAERGCKLLIPYINRINKKYHKTFVLPLVGSSVLHYTIDKMSEKEAIDFLVNHNYSLTKKNNRLSNHLKKIDYILPETEGLTKLFIDFYGINNCFTLPNFRDFEEPVSKQKHNNQKIRLVFISRVMEKKGIFDLLEVISSVANKTKDLKLDIYGGIILNDEEKKRFDGYVDRDNITYKGKIDSNLVVNTLANYDLMVFPTKFVFEGIPGVIVESLLAGTPVLTSNYPQAKFLLKDGYDSLFFNMLDKDDLKKKLLYIINNKQVLETLKNSAIESGKKYTYSHEREAFLKYVCGIEEK